MQRHNKTSIKPLIVIAVIAIIILFFVGKGIIGLFKVSPVVLQYVTQNTLHLKETDGRVHVLLLGIGGGVHEGPNLTDTIIFASLDPKNKRITLVSIPRDLWSPDLKAKVNTAYAFGEEKQKGGGIKLARSVMEKIIGQPINYVIRVDFQGFVKAVDLLGGITIHVDNTLDDYEYPIEGKENDPCGHTEDELASLATASSQLEAFPCRYKHIHFDKGTIHMDGQTALEFVRSRHALGSEGSDFARSRRQEKVISAVKDKIFSTETLLNPAKIISLYNVLATSIDTDIKQDEFDDFIKLAQKMRGSKITSATVDTGDTSTEREGLLMHPDDAEPYGGQWVLAPTTGSDDFTKIHTYILCTITKGNCNITPTPSTSPKQK